MKISNLCNGAGSLLCNRSMWAQYHLPWYYSCVFQCVTLLHVYWNNLDRLISASFLSSLMCANCGIMSSGCVFIRNFTIRFMPIPIIDASQALKASPEKTEDALLKVWQGFSLVPQASSCLVMVLQDFYRVANMLYATTLGKSKMTDDCFTSLSLLFLITLVFYHDSGFMFVLPDWELFVQEPWNQKIPTGAGLQTAAGHRDHNHTTGV